MAQPAMGACWRPLLSGAQREQALATVDKLAVSIGRQLGALQDPSLGRGQAGLALFYGQVANALESSWAADVAERCLEGATEALTTEVMDSSLLSGFSGVAWAVEVVEGLLDPGSSDRGETIDEVLEHLLARPGLWAAPHDLVRGVTGIGVYALERYPRPLAADCLRHIVARLRESAREDAAGAYWWTPARVLSPEVVESHPFGLADLGLAHGQPGAIALLGAIAQTGIDPRATALLNEAVPWLLSQAITTQTGLTFPASVAPGVQARPARSAWCYGDPGVAVALMRAAQGTGRTDWEQAGTSLARGAAERPHDQAGVVDGALCHGAAGLAHLFNRVWQATGDPSVHEAALSWVDVTLQFCRAAERLGEEWVLGTADPRQEPWTGVGVLEGASGIGLTLLAAATPAEPTWDGMLLMSRVVPRGSQLSGVGSDGRE